jgi:hypothetical protein
MLDPDESGFTALQLHQQAVAVVRFNETEKHRESVTAGEQLIFPAKNKRETREAYRKGLLLLSIFRVWLVYVDCFID